MISDKWISSVDYYLDSARKPGGPSRDRLAYYSEAGDYGEPPGIWYCPGGGGGTLAPSGQTVHGFELKRLAAGCDIRTGRPLSDQVGKTKDRRAGIDVCMSPPKDFSILFAAAPPGSKKRDTLESILYKVSKEILDLIHSNGLIECRQGPQGEIRLPSKELASAMFLHHSSRDGDPQLHVHCLVMNIAMRQDGSYGAINNEKFKENRKLLDAVFKFRIARELEQLGIRLESHEEHGFTVSGITPALREDFSERRMKIKLAAAGKGFETKDDGEAAQTIALETRGKKSDIPPLHLLDPLWVRTFEEHGTDLSFAGLDGSAIQRDSSLQPVVMEEVTGEALSKITETA